MKLSKYAETLGIKYQTAYDHFKKNKIPGAYQLSTGTVIVPDTLVDPAMLSKAIAEDLDNKGVIDDETGEVKPTKPRTQNDMLKQKLDNFKNLVTIGNDGFDPTQFVANGSDLPKPPKKRRDTEAEQEILLEKASGIIDTHIHNYITADELMKLEKNNKMRDAHVEKLFEIDFLIKTSKDMIVRLKEGIDEDEAIPNIYTTLAQFQTQMMTFMNNRSKHLTEVENYWYDIADKHGLISDEESKMEEIAEMQAAVEKQAAEDSPEDQKESGRIISNVKLNENIDKIIEELKAKEDADASKNPRQSHNPYEEKQKEDEKAK
jgi:hypothetical protein